MEPRWWCRPLLQRLDATFQASWPRGRVERDLHFKLADLGGNAAQNAIPGPRGVNQVSGTRPWRLWIGVSCIVGEGGEMNRAGLEALDRERHGVVGSPDRRLGSHHDASRLGSEIARSERDEVESTNAILARRQLRGGPSQEAGDLPLGNVGALSTQCIVAQRETGDRCDEDEECRPREGVAFHGRPG